MSIQVSGTVVIDDSRNLLTTGVGTSVITTNTSAIAGTFYFITASLTLTLPATPAIGDRVKIMKSSLSFNPIVARNGLNIMGLAEDLTVDVLKSFDMIYTDATNGWVLS
jgi:hypothetical protein